MTSPNSGVLMRCSFLQQMDCNFKKNISKTSLANNLGQVQVNKGTCSDTSFELKISNIKNSLFQPISQRICSILVCEAKPTITFHLADITKQVTGLFSQKTPFIA